MTQVHVGDILCTVGVFSTVGDTMSTVGGYLEYLWGYSVPWGDIMMHMEGYHEYRGGKIFCYLSTPTISSFLRSESTNKLPYVAI